MPQDMYDIIVVGAGIVGCSTAYYLTRSGLKVAIVDKGSSAGEASGAAAGMLAPVGNEPPDGEHPLAQLSMAALRFYDGLDEQMRVETGLDIGLVDVPTLRPAFDDESSVALQAVLTAQQTFLPGLLWLEEKDARDAEPLLPEGVQGALSAAYRAQSDRARIVGSRRTLSRWNPARASHRQYCGRAYPEATVAGGPGFASL